MLEVDIEKKLGNFSLKVSFIAENEVMALLGASGSGKSVTLKCIAGIIKPDKGRIALNGKELFNSEKRINLTPQKRNIGYLFQNYALFPNMTVEQNIACGVRNRADREKGICEQIKAMHLEGMEKHYPYQLSGGQQQRVALARILVGKPDLILLDEPLAALDSYLRWNVEIELSDTVRRAKVSTVFVSHSRDEVYRICDSVSVMDNGLAQKKISKKRFFEDPSTVAACLLSGCKNVSMVESLGEGKLRALDWGNIVLSSSNSIDSDVTHIGIRSHYFRKANMGEGENKFTAVIERVNEDTFSTVIMIRPRGANMPIRVEWEKNEKWKSCIGMELFIEVLPQDIMLLTSS